MWEDDQVHEECGLFGIFRHPQAVEKTFLGLYTLQHRGQESSGIAVSDGQMIAVHKAMGLVAEAYQNGLKLSDLRGHLAIGHNRYSTTGSSSLQNAQPILIKYKKGQLAAAHNGNLINAATLREAMEEDGSIFQSTTDSEIVVHLVAKSSEPTIPDMIADALRRVEGAYCFLFMTEQELIGVRDPHGFRPLCIGRLGDSYILASETCALDIVDATYVRDVEPGEIVVIDDDGLTSYRPFPPAPPAFCIFEYIYFARPDSKVFGENVDKPRRRFGRQLAREHPCDADIVISVPDSANTAALGYAEESGIRFEIGLIRNHYIGRTFIDPSQTMRDFKVRVKYNPVKGVLKGRRVVMVEDSIVRGTTLKQLVRMVRQSGAKEVHVRVSCPPIRHPCYYGIDMQTRAELIASRPATEQVREFLGADSLGYLSIEGMLSVAPSPGDQYCTACFSGWYPIEPKEPVNKLLLELKCSG
ncbi:MAG: amidophosphoribosyltransferase [Candidatus Latescibacteria bacterium]|nr:amidophosphoribosyltransferase [Candidatus Latescibacterota bacterium]